MRQTRRFHSKQEITEGKVSITEEEARHMHVFRLKQGDKVELFDDLGTIGLGTIETIEKESIEIKITEIQKVRKTGVFKAIATAVPKGKRFDLLIQKATELGADKIILLTTKRTIVKPRETKIERLKKIAVEAAKQSKQNKIPEITEPVTVDKLIEITAEYELKIIAQPNADKTIKEVMQSTKPQKIICLIGPEGGFTNEEIALAEKNNFIPASLGQEILRTETAGIAVLAMMNYEYDR